MSIKGVTVPIEPYFDEDKYYNYGDNPVFKRFMKIAMENARGGKVLDHRTHILDKGIRLSLTRNFDDFLQRDLKAKTFLRSFCIWTLSAMWMHYTHRIVRNLIPVGRNGITKVNETAFYQNFGILGVAGVYGWYGFAAYTLWKCTRFTVHKFYRHVIKQDRNWVHESLEISNYGDYIYSDSILSNETNLKDSIDKRIMKSLPEEKFPYYGPYTTPA